MIAFHCKHVKRATYFRRIRSLEVLLTIIVGRVSARQSGAELLLFAGTLGSRLNSNWGRVRIPAVRRQEAPCHRLIYGLSRTMRLQRQIKAADWRMSNGATCSPGRVEWWTTFSIVSWNVPSTPQWNIGSVRLSVRLRGRSQLHWYDWMCDRFLLSVLLRSPSHLPSLSLSLYLFLCSADVVISNSDDSALNDYAELLCAEVTYLQRGEKNQSALSANNESVPNAAYCIAVLRDICVFDCAHNPTSFWRSFFPFV